MARAIILVLAIVWLVAQGVASAHAHDHDHSLTQPGPDCAICHAMDRADDPAAPVSPISTALLPALQASAIAFEFSALVHPTTGKSPPSRAPPFS